MFDTRRMNRKKNKKDGIVGAGIGEVGKVGLER